MKKINWEWVWMYIIGLYFGVISAGLYINGSSYYGVVLFIGLFLVIIKPEPKKKTLFFKYLPAHGAGCEYEKVLNKNNENIKEEVK